MGKNPVELLPPLYELGLVLSGEQDNGESIQPARILRQEPLRPWILLSAEVAQLRVVSSRCGGLVVRAAAALGCCSLDSKLLLLEATHLSGVEVSFISPEDLAEVE